MADKTKVYRVVFNDGTNHNAIVFDEPAEGKSYQANEMTYMPGGTACPVNEEGDIPHREPTGEEGENLGITWHFAK